MKALPVSVAVLLLVACGQKRATDGARNNSHAANIHASVIERKDAAVPVPSPRDPQGPTAPSPEDRPQRTIAPPQPSAETRYRALGTEPFWAVTVKGGLATLERPDKAPMRFSVTRQDDGRAVRYLGDGFSLTVTDGPCSDGMSDAAWSNHVAVAFGEGTLKGCGGEREDF